MPFEVYNINYFTVVANNTGNGLRGSNRPTRTPPHRPLLGDIVAYTSSGIIPYLNANPKNPQTCFYPNVDLTPNFGSNMCPVCMSLPLPALPSGVS